MSTMLSALLFAASATAQLTTTMQMPWSGFDTDEMHYIGSVVGVEGGKTTMAMSMKALPAASEEDKEYMDYYGLTELYTFQGSTWLESAATTEIENSDDEVMDMTMSMGCVVPTGTRSAMATCTYSVNGAYVWATQCGSYAAEETSTPSYCTESSGSRIPDEEAVSETAFEFAPFEVIITAGADMLTANAGATPTNSGATPTNAGPRPTGDVEAAKVAPTGPSDAPGAPDDTSAASALKVAPVFVLGAAVAAFLL
ncbi:hypothetical protein M011DRAFT_456886 [Sporormia fimetaria CBS 119925]|uniref:Uncharacterized protein n=1 Tax=Sporormia fimetaria CBS 119925 TaxID=1340428 RepID=A0A6A6VIQ0_9PLEO|nr:hypothetical protein M011DRAFT_456886 [Sporormia fimetaria CBS 119925]